MALPSIARIGLLISAVPIRIGVYCLRRGRKPIVAEETGSEQISSREDAEALIAGLTENHGGGVEDDNAACSVTILKI